MHPIADADTIHVARPSSAKTITVPLSSPIRDGARLITDLTFRKAKTGDLVAADAVKGETAKTLAILACMADVSLPIMKEIDLEDFAMISEKVAPLMGEFPKAADGSTS
jgi:hypothetical protein